MPALVLNCTLKPSPEKSNTDDLAAGVVEALRKRDVAITKVRLVDLDIRPGVATNQGSGDEWPIGPPPD